MGDRLTHVFLWFWGLDEPQNKPQAHWKHGIFFSSTLMVRWPWTVGQWTPPRPDGFPSDHPLWLSPDHKLIKIKFSNWLLKLG